MRRKLLYATLALPLVVLVALALYVRFGDHRQTIERLVGQVLGRRLEIAGELQLEFGATTRIVVEDVTLAGPEWDPGTPLLHLDHLEGSVDLRSIFSGPVRLDNVRVAGARVHLETDGSGRANWDFGFDGSSHAAEESAIEPPVLLQSLALSDVTIGYDSPDRDAPLEIGVDTLSSRTDDGGMIDMQLSGRINAIPFDLSGTLGTLANLIAGNMVEHNFAGRVGNIEIEMVGQLVNLGELKSPEVQLRIESPDLAETMETLGLPAPLPGLFRAEAYLSPDGDRIAVVARAELGELSLWARGSIGTLLDPGKLDLELSLSGPDLSAIGSLADVDGLPPGEFELSARLVHEEGRLWFHDLHARVGDNTLSLDGVYAGLARYVDSDVAFEFEGPDLSVFSRLAGVQLPPLPFHAGGYAARKPDRLVVRDLRGRVGRSTVEMSATIGMRRRLSETQLDLRLSSPDASVFSALAGFDLPAAPIKLRGGLHPGQGRLLLENVEAEIGGTRLSVDGSLVRTDRFIGSTLRFHYHGADLATIGYLREFDTVPHVPFDATGQIHVVDEGYALPEFQIQVGEITFQAQGHVGPIPILTGTDLQISVGGPDLSRVSAAFGHDDWPALPYRLSGGVEILEQGYDLDTIELQVGSLDVKVSGRLGPLPEAPGTELDIELSSNDLPAFGEQLEIESLPAGRFFAGGHVTREPDGYRVHDFVTRLGAHELRAEGKVGAADRGVGTDLILTLAGPALDGLVSLLAGDGVVDRYGIPDEAYEIKADLRIVEAGYRLSGLALHAGGSIARVDGTLGWLPEAHGSDLSFQGKGSDGAIVRAMVGALAGVDLPAASFSLSGRLQRETHGTRFHDVRLLFGDYAAEIDGILGEPPLLIGTRLDVRAAGPGLELVKRFVDLPMHDAPFEISGHLDGTPQEFALEEFSARVGRSDVSGSVHVDLQDKPKIRAELSSEFIDLPFLRGAGFRAEGGEPAPASDETTSGLPGSRADNRQVEEDPPGENGGRWIPDDPLPVDWLQTHDAEVRWHIDRFDTSLMDYHDVDLDVSLQDGRLQAGPVRGRGEYGGSATARLVLEPVGETYRLTYEVRAEKMRYALSKAAENREQRVPHDVLIELTGTGTSLHTIAASADGRLIVLQGEGRLDNNALDTLTNDVLAKLLSSLNPFSKEEPYSRLECGTLVIFVEHGVAQLRSLIAVTDKMKIAGRGSIDLDTEKLDLSWVAKPRKGIGLSASSIINPYIKLGGTLSNPSLAIKPLQATTATAAAITTGGLSILAKGFWDRFTSGTRACEKMKKQLLREEWNQ